MATIFGKTNKFLFVFVVFLLSFFVAFAQTISAPKVISETATLQTDNIVFRASVWTNEGIPIPVVTWFKYRIVGDTKIYTTRERERMSNSSFNFQIPFNSKNIYCFTPYAQKLDIATNQKIGDIGIGLEVCYPNIPYVETLFPGQYTATTALFKGKVVSFRGLTSGYAFFQRYDKNNPLKIYSNIGGRVVARPTNDTTNFSGYFSDFNTDQNGPLCYKACISQNILTYKTAYNCGEEMCFPLSDQTDGKFDTTSKIEILKSDCQKAKVTIDISCLGKIIDKERMPMDIVFVLDKSGTMQGQAWESTKKAVKAFISKLDKTNDNIALVSFARYASYDNNSGLTDNYDEVIQGLDKITIASNRLLPPATNIGEGLRLAEDLFSKKARKDSKRITILITDGIANAGEKKEESEQECPSYPEVANNCTRYAEKQANLIKGKYNAEIYTVRYSLPSIDNAHPKSAIFSKSLLKNIAWPLTVMNATTPQEIETQFAQIVYALTQYYQRDYFCSNVNAKYVMPANVKYVQTLTNIQPTQNNQELSFDIGKIINGTRKIEFIIQFPDEKNQLANVIPDSKITYTDWKGNSQEKLFNQLEARDLLKCADVKLETEKIAIPYREEKYCQIVEIALKVKCVLTDSNNDLNNKPMCKNVVVMDYLPKGVIYSKTPYEARPSYESLTENNPNTGETKIVWKLPDMLPGSQKTIRFNVKFDTAEKNQLADIYPNSIAEAVNSKNEKVSSIFPETKVDPVECIKCITSKNVVITGNIVNINANGAYTTPKEDATIVTDAGACMPFHLNDFSDFNISIQRRVSDKSLSGIDTLIILPNSCETYSTIGDWSAIDKFINNGGKAIIYDSGCSKWMNQEYGMKNTFMDYSRLSLPFFTNSTLAPWTKDEKPKIVEENTLSNSNTSDEAYINASKLGLINKHGLGYGINAQTIYPVNANQYCADINIKSGTVQAYSKDYGKGLLIYNGVPRFLWSYSGNGTDWWKQTCNYNANPTTEEGNLTKLILLDLKQKWDPEKGKSCGLPCSVPIPKLHSGQKTQGISFLDPEIKLFQTTKISTIISTNQTSYTKKKGILSWFEISPDENFINKDKIIKIKNHITNNVFLADLRYLENATNYYVRIVIDVFGNLIYSKPILNTEK